MKSRVVRLHHTPRPSLVWVAFPVRSTGHAALSTCFFTLVLARLLLRAFSVLVKKTHGNKSPTRPPIFWEVVQHRVGQLLRRWIGTRILDAGQHDVTVSISSTSLMIEQLHGGWKRTGNTPGSQRGRRGKRKPRHQKKHGLLGVK